MDPRLRFSSLDARFGVACVLGSFLFFRGLNNLLKGVQAPQWIICKGGDEVWRWRNIVISWVHALLIGTWDILCFYYYPNLVDDLVEHVVPFTYYMVAVSVGYFLFDLIDTYNQGKIIKLWEITLHHFAVLIAFIYNILNVKFIGYTVISLLSEVNSIFLHTRKLMQMYRVPFASSVYRLNAFINLSTFAVCRGFALTRITYGIYSEPDRISSFYKGVLCVSMFIMNMLNPILFWILLRNDFLRSSSASSKGKSPNASSTNSPLLEPHPNGVKKVVSEFIPPVTVNQFSGQFRPMNSGLSDQGLVSDLR